MTTARVRWGRSDQIQDVLLPNELDEQVVAGMAASLLGAADRVSHELMDAGTLFLDIKRHLADLDELT